MREFWRAQGEDLERDLVGYGRYPPKVTWPGNARVAVSLVLNYEEGSERSFPAGDGVSESVGEAGRAFPAGKRNLAVESTFEYGSRAGVYRVLRLLRELDVNCTVFACAVALEINPEATSAILEGGHEIASHGWRWTEHWNLTREQEREEIAKAVALFQKTCGAVPKGWYTRFAPTEHTRELLVEAGFEYDNDAYNDDLPYYVNVRGKDHLVLPYSQIHNDARFLSGHLGSPDDFVDLLKRGYDYLWEEGATRPQMMSIGVHARYMGQPARASALRDFLRYARQKGSTWFARRDEIASWWKAHHASFPRVGT